MDETTCPDGVECRASDYPCEPGECLIQRRSPMDERTREALEGSIEKWKAIERGDGMDLGITNCPLCALFINDCCSGCPVWAATGHTHCAWSPYGYFRAALNAAAGSGAVCIDEAPLDEARRLKRLARDEREFLESLLPRRCPRAHSDMTPCVIKDGALAADDGGVCVGCGCAIGEDGAAYPSP